MLPLPETFPHLTWYVSSPPPPSAYPHLQTLPRRPNLGAAPSYFRFQIQTERWEWAELPERRPGAQPARAVGFPPTRSREKLSNLGAGLGMPGDQWAEAAW